MLKSSANEHYYIFPGYGPDFRDMTRWLAHWREAFPGSHRFWPGFSSGGILAVSLEIPEWERNSLALANAAFPLNTLHGLKLGNKPGMKLARFLSCVIPDRPPAFAVRMGLAQRVPDPTVKATAEHVDGVDGRRYLLVVPKTNLRSIKMMEWLPTWFATFGVTIEISSPSIPPELRLSMHDWFDNPERPMFALRMDGGEANAAWQLAVTYYVAEHWDTQARGLDSIHFVTNIEDQPSFRKNWTSNK